MTGGHWLICQAFESLEDQEKVRSIFSDNVEVRFLLTNQPTDPPESFQQHLKQVRESIRQRRFSGDGP